MKYKILLIAIFVVVYSSFASEVNVPKEVKDAFAKLHPGVKSVHWENEHNEFEAEFTDHGNVMVVVFDTKGNLVETETLIKNADLPAGVEKSIAHDHPGYTIVEAMKIVNAKGVLTFEVEIKKDKDIKDTFWDKDGKFIKEVHKDHEHHMHKH